MPIPLPARSRYRRKITEHRVDTMDSALTQGSPTCSWHHNSHIHPDRTGGSQPQQESGCQLAAVAPRSRPHANSVSPLSLPQATPYSAARSCRDLQRSNNRLTDGDAPTTLSRNQHCQASISVMTISVTLLLSHTIICSFSVRNRSYRCSVSAILVYY